MIRVVLVDDQALVRAGIRGLLDLTEDIRVIAEGTNGEEALSLVASLAPDLLLLDIRMPVMSGIQVVQSLSANNMLLPIILLTTFDDDEALLQGMHAGAKGFLLKDISPERLADAIRHVSNGDSLFLPALTESIVDRLSLFTDSEPDDYAETPTKRELEILRLLASGWNNREIANAIGTTEGTVKNHVSNLLSKLGVRDRTRAVLKAVQQGWI
ncbi:MAG: response regulator transcription factor [Sideroxydans sp.]|nr:response regulator transcription factor [Sideroxydans sp.]